MVISLTSPWVPVEWVEAHGLAPRGAWSDLGEPAGAVPEGVCTFAQTMVEFANQQSESAIVFTTACDQLRRAADALATKGSPRLFLFNMPATWQSSMVRRLYHGELERLGKFFETLGGRTPTPATLKAIIQKYEERRNYLRTFIRQNHGRQSVEALTRFFHDGSVPPSQDVRDPITPRGVPLALVGGPLLTSHWALLDAIESAGGCVTLNATEPGERCLLPPLPDLADDESPLAALADHYFDHALDVFHRSNSRLYAWLKARLVERNALGIVLWAQVGCDLWRAEAASLREAFGLPVLALDSHGIRAGGLRDTNRLDAFIESLR